MSAFVIDRMEIDVPKELRYAEARIRREKVWEKFEAGESRCGASSSRSRHLWPAVLTFIVKRGIMAKALREEAACDIL